MESFFLKMPILQLLYFFLLKFWLVGPGSTKVHGDKTKVICANSKFELRNVNVGEVAWV